MSDPALSSEELDFIREVFSSQLIGKPLSIPAFKVDGGPLANALLTRLGLHANLSLEAKLDRCHVSFPLQLVEDELLMALPVVPRHEECPTSVPLASSDDDFEVANSEKPNPFAALAALRKDGKGT